MDDPLLNEIQKYCKSENRICPQPQKWNILYLKLKNRSKLEMVGIHLFL